MVQITVKVTPPIKKVLRYLSSLSKDISETESANAKAAVWLDAWVQRNFKGQGVKVGGWLPLKAGGRRKKGGGIDYSAKVLQDTTTLRHSFKPFHSKKTAGIGSELPYSKAHEYGMPVRKLPARRMLPRHDDKDIVDGLTKIYNNHVKQSIKKNWEGKFNA